MCKVVIDRDAIDLPLDLHAALDVFEGLQRLNRHGSRHARVTRGGDGGQRIRHIVLADQIPTYAALMCAVKHHVKAILVTYTRAPAIGNAVTLNGRPASTLHHAIKTLLRTIADYQSIARHAAHQMMKLRFDGSEVGKDIGVIKFQVIQYRRARAVVHELGALVEKGRVVLVSFNHKKRCIR